MGFSAEYKFVTNTLTLNISSKILIPLVMKVCFSGAQVELSLSSYLLKCALTKDLFQLYNNFTWYRFIFILYRVRFYANLDSYALKVVGLLSATIQ